MTTLLTFGPFGTTLSASPFCTKAMICLTQAGLDWQPDFQPDFSTLPHGKLPVLRTEAGLIPDSNGILRWIAAQGKDPFAGMTPRDRAMAHGLLRMLEENLRLGLVHDRWMDAANWPIVKSLFFGDIPEEARDAVTEPIRDRLRTWLAGHGCGRVSQAEALEAFFAPDLAVIDSLLGESDWLMGERPTVVDAMAVPLLEALATLPHDTPLSLAVRALPRLTAYVARGQAELYPPVQAVLNSAAAAA